MILIKKAGDGSKKIKGCWDSIHVVEVQEKSSGRTAHYKLTSTVMLWLQTNKSGSGTMNLGGSLTRQVSRLPCTAPHRTAPHLHASGWAGSCSRPGCAERGPATGVSRQPVSSPRPSHRDVVSADTVTSRAQLVPH